MTHMLDQIKIVKDGQTVVLTHVELLRLYKKLKKMFKDVKEEQ